MKDIDFDELDRAVNSLIGPGTTPAAVPATAPAVPVTAAPAPILSTTPPLAERRSSGRFMDVVHPSSDMRPVAVPPRPVTPAPVPPPTPEPAATTWPDPIDMHDAANKEDTTPEPTPPAPEPANDASTPLESPFLSDAKVEKRPLGAFSNEVHESGPAAPAVVPKPIVAEEIPSTPPVTMTEDTPKVTDHPIQNDTPLPAELQPGLLSIEANENPNKTDASVPIGPTSITKQYTEQPSTGDKPAGTMFNTEAYKKPQGSKKKKSGWLVVLWIFLLLVIGAGIGAAVYFFVLPRL